MTSKRYGAGTDGPYRTDFEQRIADQLTTKGVVFDYEPTRLRYTDRHGQQRITRPDFYLSARSNDPQLGMFVESKAYLSRQQALRYESIKASRSEVDLRFVFENPQRPIDKLTIKDDCGNITNITYAEWADLHGFKWAAEAIPNAWLKELKKK